MDTSELLYSGPEAPKLLYSEPEAARVIDTTPDGLRYLRRQKKGPRYIKRGRRVLYARVDLEEYVEELRRDHRGGAA